MQKFPIISFELKFSNILSWLHCKTFSIKFAEANVLLFKFLEKNVHNLQVYYNDDEGFRSHFLR